MKSSSGKVKVNSKLAPSSIIEVRVLAEKNNFHKFGRVRERGQ